MSATKKQSTPKKTLVSTETPPKQVSKSLDLFAPLMGLLAAILVIAVMNHQYLYAQAMMWMAPASTMSTPIVIGEKITVSQNPKVIIPKLNIDAPVVYGMDQTDEPSIQKSLESGVLHFAGTPAPGERGNAVFVGHSSNDVWAPGDYKFVFALLDRLEIGDEYALHYQGVKYTYKVTAKTVVEPRDISVVQNTSQPVSTLITCTPTGTNLKRLVIRGEQISPVPIVGSEGPQTNLHVTELPGN